MGHFPHAATGWTGLESVEIAPKPELYWNIVRLALRRLGRTAARGIRRISIRSSGAARTNDGALYWTQRDAP